MTAFKDIPIADIRPGVNCRDSLKNLDDLAKSIKEIGLLQPLVVRPMPDHYRLICGYRRHAACLMVGLKKIPCRVREMTDAEEAVANLAENETRERVNPIETGKAVKRMMEEFGMTQLEISEKLGKNQAWVSNHLRILKLPPVMQTRLSNFEIGVTSALKPFRQRREVSIIDEHDPSSELQYFSILLKRITVMGVKQMARRQRTTTETFVEENLALAVDWKALGLPDPYENVVK